MRRTGAGGHEQRSGTPYTVESDRFRYGGDYIQPGGPDTFPAEYAGGVGVAVQRTRFTPEQFTAIHMKPGAWIDIERIAMGAAS